MVAPDVYYTVSDAAFFLRNVISRPELVRLVEKGAVPCIYRNGEIFLLGSSLLDIFSGNFRK